MDPEFSLQDVVKGEDGYLEVLNGCPLREDLLIGKLQRQPRCHLHTQFIIL